MVSGEAQHWRGGLWLLPTSGSQPACGRHHHRSLPPDHAKAAEEQTPLENLMMTWKVWADDNDPPLFEGTEAAARQYLIEHLLDTPDAVLESPDGDSYSYKDGVWVLLGTAGFWGPNGASSTFRQLSPELA